MSSVNNSFIWVILIFVVIFLFISAGSKEVIPNNNQTTNNTQNQGTTNNTQNQGTTNNTQNQGTTNNITNNKSSNYSQYETNKTLTVPIPGDTSTGMYCLQNSDCVPNKACNPNGCVSNLIQTMLIIPGGNPDIQFCTTVCGILNCGAGSCSCVNKKCYVVPT